MTQKEFFKLFHLAMVEMREEAYNIKNGKIFVLANLFHNTPLEIHSYLNEGLDGLEEIISRYENENCDNQGPEDKWIINRLNQVRANSKEE